MKNYSQNNEQQVILDYFGDRVGTFLDIGAYNGPDISNTWALLERGWRGVFVEPNPFNLVPLIEACRPYAKQVKVICAGAGCEPWIGKLHIDQSPGRGWAASFSNHNPGVISRHPVEVYVPILHTPMLLFDYPMELVSIDAEWAEHDIFRSFEKLPSTLAKTEMIIVEPGGISRVEARLKLFNLGFKVQTETPENIIAAR